MSSRNPPDSDFLRYIDLAEPKLAEAGYVLYLRRSIPNKKGRKDSSEEDYEKPTKIDEVSIEQQRKYCREFAARKGLPIVAVFEEVESAKIPDQRGEFRKMLKYFQEHSNLGVLAWSPDRLSRNALEAGMLIQYHLDKQIVDFQFVTYYFHQDSSGLEHLMIEFARAMGYSLRLSKTVSRGMYDAYHRFKRSMSRPKFGYEQLLKTMPDGQRKRVNFPVPHHGKDGRMGEFDVVQLAFALRRQKLPFDEIAKLINDEGFITKQGRPGKMTKNRLTQSGKTKDGYDKIGILRDTYYYGVMKGNLGIEDIRNITETDDEGNAVEFVPAVTEEEFLECQVINEAKAKTKKQKHDHLPFGGEMIRCGHCGYTITPQAKKNDLYVYYYCSNSACTGHRSHAQSKGKSAANGMTGEKLFKLIGKIFLQKFKPTCKDMTAYLLYLEKRNKWNRMGRERNIKSYNTQITDAEKQIEEHDARLTAALAKGVDRETEVRIRATHKKQVTVLSQQIKAKSERITKLRSQERPVTLDVDEWLELMNNLSTKWKDAKLPQKKKIARSIFLELVIKNGKLASYKCKDAYKALEDANLDGDGGRGWI